MFKKKDDNNECGIKVRFISQNISFDEIDDIGIIRKLFYVLFQSTKIKKGLIGILEFVH